MSVRLLFLGDSIAAESTIGFVPITVNVISQTFHVTADSFNSAVPGSNVLDLLDRAQQLLPLEVHPFTAAVIFIGINDSKILAQFHEPLVPLDLFSRRLGMLVERLEHAGVVVALCGLPDLHFSVVQENNSLKEYWYWVPEDYRRYNREIRRIAQAGQSRVFVDLNAAFRSFSGGLDSLFGPDGVHPSVTGHSVIAEALSECLVKLLETAGVERGH